MMLVKLSNILQGLLSGIRLVEIMDENVVFLLQEL